MMASDESASPTTATATGGWREGIAVLAMVLAPVELAIAMVAIGLVIRAAWQSVHGMPSTLPAKADLQSAGLLCYVAVSWADVAVVWRWSGRAAACPATCSPFRRLTLALAGQQPPQVS